LWRRPWPDCDDVEAKVAFELAVGEGVRPDKILDAAKGWIEAADHPRFLPSLARWLAGRGWEKSPPGRGRPQQNDAGPEKHRPRPRRDKNPDLARIAMLAGGFVEQPDGRLVWGGGR
jgi:hypothetical protein